MHKCSHVYAVVWEPFCAFFCSLCFLRQFLQNCGKYSPLPSGASVDIKHSCHAVRTIYHQVTFSMPACMRNATRKLIILPAFCCCTPAECDAHEAANHLAGLQRIRSSCCTCGYVLMLELVGFAVLVATAPRIEASGCRRGSCCTCIAPGCTAMTHSTLCVQKAPPKKKAAWADPSAPVKDTAKVKS